MKISRMNKGSWGKVRAFFDLQTEDGFVIKGFKMVEGANGIFVGFPSKKNNDGEYYDTIYASKELRVEITSLAKEEYKNPSETQEDQSVKEMPLDEIPF